MSFWKTLFGVKEKPTKATSQAPKATKKAEAKSSILPPLCEAAKAGKAQEIQQLLSAGADRDACDEEGQCALHYAALCGHADIVEILLAAGAEVDAKNNGGVTPLHLAATLGNPSVAKALMFGNGANTEARDNWGWTPLHKALILDRVEFICALAEGGADLEATIMITAATPSEFAKLSGMTALELAKALGKADCAKALIAAGTKKSMSNRSGSVNVREKLNHLIAALKILEEPKFGGQETKEYHSHKACEAFAHMLTLVPDTKMSDLERFDIKRRFDDYTRDNYGEGLVFDHPWTERAKILKEIYNLVFPT